MSRAWRNPFEDKQGLHSIFPRIDVGFRRGHLKQLGIHRRRHAIAPHAFQDQKCSAAHIGILVVEGLHNQIKRGVVKR